MRELVQKLFLNGKMVTPQAINIIREHNLKVEDLLKIKLDIIDHNSLAELIGTPNNNLLLAEKTIETLA